LAPKDMSSSLLEELYATIYERRAVDFVQFYMNNYIIKFDC